jgi:hypothetical protein
MIAMRELQHNRAVNPAAEHYADRQIRVDAAPHGVLEQRPHARLGFVEAVAADRVAVVV